MKDSQLVQNAQDRYLYGTFIDASEAFNKGLMQASKGRPLQTSDPVGVVKNNYEEQLEGYLNKLPDDVDLAAVPDKYRNNIANFLSVQKSKYVNLANQVNEYEVGSEMYMDITNQMNNIRNSFENLDNQMKTYGKNKAEIIDNIQNQATSLYGENQANVNLLRSVYTEQFDMAIDDYGNIAFSGDDGIVALNDLPGYELKDYKAAKSLMTLGSNAYKSGVVLKEGGIMYNQYKNSIRAGVDQGGRNTLMSLIYDGLVGETKMIDDPYIAQNVEAYKNGSMTFEALRDVVVDNYMDVLVETSRSGYKAKQTRIVRSRAGRGGGYGGRDYKSPITKYSSKYGEDVIIQMPYDLAKNPVRIMSLTGEKLEGFDDIQEETATSSQQSNQPFPARVSTQDDSNADLYTKWGGSLTKKSTAPTVDTPGQNEIQEMIQHLKKINPGQSAEYYKKQAKKSLGL